MLKSIFSSSPRKPSQHSGGTRGERSTRPAIAAATQNLDRVVGKPLHCAELTEPATRFASNS
jgi:hypothetical protein